MYDSVVFRIFTRLCNNHFSLIPEHSITPNRKLIPVLVFTPSTTTSSPQLLISTNLLSLWVCPYFLSNGIIQYVADFFQLAYCFQGPSMLVSVLISFLWVRNIPVHGYATLFLATNQFINIWIVFVWG